jgi:hypothetical protein
MHSEKRDNLLAERLADALPEGSGFREEAVWQGLSASLQQARKKKRAVMLRLAAALLLLPMAWWLLRNSRSEPVEKPVVKTQQPNYSKPVQAGITQFRNDTVFGRHVQKLGKTKLHVRIRMPQDMTFSDKPIEIQAAPLDTSVITSERINTERASASLTPRRFRIAHANDAPLNIPDVRTLTDDGVSVISNDPQSASERRPEKRRSLLSRINPFQ